MTKRAEILAEITALKSLLIDTDYKSNKLIEGLFSTMRDATALNFIAKFLAWLAHAIVEFGEVIDTRESYRQMIRKLEKELEELPEEIENKEE